MRSCNSSDVPIAILRHSRAYRLARWTQFVSIERRHPLWGYLQGTLPRAMICRNKTSVAYLNPGIALDGFLLTMVSAGVFLMVSAQLVTRSVYLHQPGIDETA